MPAWPLKKIYCSADMLYDTSNCEINSHFDKGDNHNFKLLRHEEFSHRFGPEQI